MRKSCLVAAAAILSALSLPAAAQSLKPGLWEVSSKMNNPQMDQAMAEMQKQLATLPTSERIQAEAMMRSRGVQLPQAGAGLAAKVCMTKEQAERNEPPMQGDCRITSQSRSGNTARMAFACSNPPSTGEGSFTFVSDQAYTSRMTVKTTASGKAETHTMEGAGKWLAADCGAIKPMAAPKK